MEEKTNKVIYKTTNYAQFKFLKGNRPIFASHVSKLVVSISEHNMLEDQPIIVNKQMEIIDGQHRLLAAEKMKSPIFYHITDNDPTTKDVQLLNTGNKNWSLLDFIKSHANVGNRGYQKILDFASDYNTTAAIAAGLLAGSLSSYGGHHFTAMASGKFKITAEEEARDFMDFVFDLEPYIEPGANKNRAFLVALYRALKIKGVTRKQMFEQIKDSREKVQRHMNTRKALEQLERIYNKGQKEVIRFF